MFRAAWDGRLEAYDARNGAVLWQFQTGAAGGRGPAMTYEVDGEQFVAAALGPTLWAFKLGGSLSEQPTRLPGVNPDAERPGEPTAEIEATTLVTPCCVQGGRRWAVDEYAFKPLRSRVRAGARVTFVNNGRLAHSFVSRDGSWKTGVLQPGQEAQLRFDAAGTYTFTCEAHPWSIGRITVERPPSPAARPFGSAVQAARGKASFAAACASCHGEALAGTDRVPPLAGGAFTARWAARAAGDLFDTIRTTMPPNAPGSLTTAASLDVVTYLLQANGAAAGTADVELDADWRGMRLSGIW
jgi:mono/diheme cytochrome c family protein